MTENKTKPEAASVADFLGTISDDVKRADAHVLIEMMARLSGKPAVMWGTGIIGFGQYHYKYKSGREGDMMRCGFAPRKANIVLYISTGWKARPELLKKLGKYKTGKFCLYVTRLANVDLDVLEELVTLDLQMMEERYGPE